MRLNNNTSFRLPIKKILSNQRGYRCRSFSSSTNTDGKSRPDRKKDDLVLFSYDPNSRVGTLTLNDPERYNALTIPMGQQFKSHVQRLTKHLSMPANDYRAPHNTQDELDSILLGQDISKMSALILTGSGDNSFCTGADYSWLRSLKTSSVHVNSDMLYSFYNSFLCIRELPVPTIAALHGTAIGMGACLALACDLRIISGGASSPREGAKIGFPFAKLGMHTGMGGSHFAPIVMGESQAMEALLLGKVFDAEEALRVGLVNRVVSVDCKNVETNKKAVEMEALELADSLAEKHPLAIRSMVRTMRMREDGMGGGLEAALRREAYAQAVCFQRTDFGEGIDAVMERRIPEFGDYGDA